MGILARILQRRSPIVHVLGPDATVAAAVELMDGQRVGIVPIVEDDHLAGVFSERDLLRRVIARGRAIDKTPLRDVMTPNPVTASPSEDRGSALRKMRQVGCRHLPIVAGGEVIDMLSMRDLLSVEVEERVEEIDELKRYIHSAR